MDRCIKIFLSHEAAAAADRDALAALTPQAHNKTTDTGVAHLLMA